MQKKGENVHESKKEHIESAMLHNIMELQKVHTNLIEKFDKLSKQMSDLLTLFEMAARSFAQNPANQSSEKDKDFLEKIDKLLDQNKTIAKGLTMMEERIKEKVYGAAQQNTAESELPVREMISPKPLPKF